MSSSLIGNRIPSQSLWDLNISQANFKLGKGKLSSDTILPKENFNYLPECLKILGYCEVAILNVICIFFVAWLIRNRNEKL